MVAQWANFYAYVLRARWVLGRWPSWDNPDPKTLGFDIHHWLVTAGGFSVILVFPLLALLILIAASLGKAPWRPVGAAAIAFIVFAVSAWADDQFGSWFVD